MSASRIMTFAVVLVATMLVTSSLDCIAYAQEPLVPTGGADTSASNGHIDAQQRHPRYRLCTGDVIEVVFPFTPEFNQSITVQPDGYITPTGVAELYVAGKTIAELKSLLKDGYSKILHDPTINIVLKEYEKPYFIANGQVAKPGKYEIRSDTTLTEAIAIAGGFLDSSKHSQVLLFRRLPDNGYQVKSFDVKKMLQAKNLEEDVHLRPGDMLFVPQNTISKLRKYIPSAAMTVPTY